jgi:hypothetical protein
MEFARFGSPWAGPFGAGMAAAMADLARSIAGEPEGPWKIWTGHEGTGAAGRICTLADDAVARDHVG